MIRTLADVGMSPTGLWQLWMCDCGKYRTYFVNTGHPIIQIRHEGKRLRPYDGPGVSGVQRQTDPRSIADCAYRRSITLPGARLQCEMQSLERGSLDPSAAQVRAHRSRDCQRRHSYERGGMAVDIGRV